ncbi:hypothetical protein GCM10009118_14550 [Wandonia haliotis]|uniref:Uncharacterized protein n=2 Tax=Wandonia haliotis TaxID=574963 RepID=A0ABP3Y2Q7_9FLAO
MQKMKYFCYILLLLLFVACTNKEARTIHSSDEIIETKDSTILTQQTPDYISDTLMRILLDFEQEVINDEGTLGSRWFIETGFSTKNNDSTVKIYASLNPGISLDSNNYVLRGGFKLTEAYVLIWDYKISSGYGLYLPENLPQVTDSILKHNPFYEDDYHNSYARKYKLTDNRLIEIEKEQWFK